MYRTVLAAALMSGAAACAGSDYDGGGGGGGAAWGLGPGYVSIGENKRFGVRYLPDMQAAVLNFTMVGAFDADEPLPEPPSEAEWRAAAEKAAPEGCTLAGLEQVDSETFEARYDCGGDG